MATPRGNTLKQIQRESSKEGDIILALRVPAISNTKKGKKGKRENNI